MCGLPVAYVFYHTLSFYGRAYLHTFIKSILTIALTLHLPLHCLTALSIMSLSLNALQKNDSGGGRKLMNRFSRKQSPNSRTSSSRALAINNDDSKAVSKSGANSGEGVFDNSRNGIFDNSRNGSDVVVPSGSESNPPSGRLGQRPPLLANVVDAVLIDSNMPRMNGPGQPTHYTPSTPLHPLHPHNTPPPITTTQYSTPYHLSD